MKGQVCLVGLVILLLSSSCQKATAQTPCVQPTPEPQQLKVAYADITEAREDVADYNDTVKALRSLQALADLKYQRLETKYVNRILPLKLEADIRFLQKEFQDNAKKLK